MYLLVKEILVLTLLPCSHVPGVFRGCRCDSPVLLQQTTDPLCGLPLLQAAREAPPGLTAARRQRLLSSLSHLLPGRPGRWARLQSSPHTCWPWAKRHCSQSQWPVHALCIHWTNRIVSWQSSGPFFCQALCWVLGRHKKPEVVLALSLHHLEIELWCHGLSPALS